MSILCGSVSKVARVVRVVESEDFEWFEYLYDQLVYSPEYPPNADHALSVITVTPPPDRYRSERDYNHSRTKVAKCIDGWHGWSKSYSQISVGHCTILSPYCAVAASDPERKIRLVNPLTTCKGRKPRIASACGVDIIPLILLKRGTLSVILMRRKEPLES
jgi:hypothetical protein